MTIVQTAAWSRRVTIGSIDDPHEDPRLGKAARHNRLSSKEARRALYIDFEGRKAAAPVLIGCTQRAGKRSEPRAWQAITDARFEPLAHDGEIQLLSLPDAVERILERAEAKDRLIVAWSEHELDVVTEHCPQHLGRFQARFVNARTFAVHWRNAVHGGRKPATNELADYLRLIGYEVPEGAGPGRAADTIRIVGQALEKGRGIDGLTDNQRRRWQALRDHNLHDCRGMKKVCVLAAEELDVRGR